MKPLAALLFILVAIGSLFYVLQSDGTTAEYAENSIELPSGQEPAEKDSTDRGTLANASPGSRTSAAVAAEPQERVEAAPEGDEQFDNRLTGLVMSTTMEPVAGATVTLTRSGLAGLLFVNGPVDRSGDRTAETDKEGRYSFTQITPYDRYSVESTAEGFSRSEVPNIAISTEGVYEAPPILLSVGASLSGTVTDSGGNPVPQALLQLNGMFTSNDGGEGVDTLTATTDNLGKYLITNVPMGNRSLLIKADGYANASRGGLVFRGEEPLTMPVSLEIAEMICGRVISKEGQPIAGAQILGMSFTNSNRQCRDNAETDQNGEFCLTSVAAGQYNLQVKAPGFKAASENRVKTGGASLIIEMVKQGVISGNLVAGDGPPSASYKVQLRQVHKGSLATSKLGQPVTFTESDGSFTLECSNAGDYLVEAFVPGYAPTFSEEFHFTGAQPMTGLTIHLTQGGSITGMVTDSAGNGIPKARITTRGNDWSNSLFDRALGDQFPTNVTAAVVTGNGAGKFTLKNLHPDTYQIRVKAPGYCEGSLTDLFVSEGQATSTGNIQLIRGGEITGMVIDLAGRPVISANVRLSPDGMHDNLPRNYEVRAGADGTYTIRNIFPGKYKLMATLNNESSIFMSGLSLQGENMQPVTVQDGQTQQFELKINS